jgi:hypothetical protein
MIYQHPTTAARVTIAGYPVCVGGVAFTGSESASDMALFGYVPVPPDAPAPPQPTQAEALMANADMQESVAGVLIAVQAVAALGVDISDWSFQGVTAAAQSALASADTARGIAILAAALALRTAWDRIVYHVGDMRTADDLWPELYDLAMGQ